MARYTIDSFVSFQQDCQKQEAERPRVSLVSTCASPEPVPVPASPQSPLAVRNTRTFQPSSPCQLAKSSSRSSLHSSKSSIFAVSRPQSEMGEQPATSIFATPLTKTSKPNSVTKHTQKTMSLTIDSVNSLAGVMGQSEARSVRTPVTDAVTQVRRPQSREVAYREHLFATFQALKFVRTLPSVAPAILSDQVLSLPTTTLKTIVFDLDETLIHCIQDPSQADAAIPVTFPTGETVVVGVNVRPYARECLAAVSTFCEVVVFTASQKCYADAVLDYLDPDRRWVKYRLYRENCVVCDGVYVKDLRVLGNRRMEDVIIVDNAAYSFGYQLDNGIPIISWYDDKSDCELRNLVAYLRRNAQQSDVRELNRTTFKLAGFYDLYYRDFIRPSNIFE